MQIQLQIKTTIQIPKDGGYATPAGILKHIFTNTNTNTKTDISTDTNSDHYRRRDLGYPTPTIIGIGL